MHRYDIAVLDIDGFPRFEASELQVPTYPVHTEAGQSQYAIHVPGLKRDGHRVIHLAVRIINRYHDSCSENHHGPYKSFEHGSHALIEKHQLIGRSLCWGALCTQLTSALQAEAVSVGNWY